MLASNTRDCFRAFVGQRLVGLLFDACPAHRKDLSAGNVHLIFEDGRALTISNKGSYWIETAEDIRAAVARKEGELRQTERDLQEVIAAAGAIS